MRVKSNGTGRPTLTNTYELPQEDGIRMSSKRDAPRSIMRLIGLFQVLADANDGLSLAQLSAELDSPKSSLLILLRPLVEGDYLRHENGRYFLGPSMFGFASKILGNFRFGTLIHVFMAKLRDETGETIIFATLDKKNDRIEYASVLDGPQPIRYSVPSGVARPIYCTAGGRLLMAYQERDWTDAYLARTKLVKHTEKTITDRARIMQILESIRREGISFSSEEVFLGAAGLGAPVFRADGTLAGALLIGAPAIRAASNRRALERSLVKAARGASEALGCQNYDELIGASSPESSAAALP